LSDLLSSEWTESATRDTVSVAGCGEVRGYNNEASYVKCDFGSFVIQWTVIKNITDSENS
jgi:hypothetical protein